MVARDDVGGHADAEQRLGEHEGVVQVVLCGEAVDVDDAVAVVAPPERLEEEDEVENARPQVAHVVRQVIVEGGDAGGEL